MGKKSPPFFKGGREKGIDPFVKGEENKKIPHFPPFVKGGRGDFKRLVIYQ
jgi:hypothetical protein